VSAIPSTARHPHPTTRSRQLVGTHARGLTLGEAAAYARRVKSKPPTTRPAIRSARTVEMPTVDPGDFADEDATRVEPEPPRFAREPAPAVDDDATQRHPTVPRLASPRKPARTPASHAPATPPAPPRAPSRIHLQLAQLLARRRRAIDLGLAQASALSGIPAADLERYEREPTARVPYEHVVVLARVLGIPTSELPGLRDAGETPVQQAVKSAARALAEPLRVVYTSDGGDDRWSGPVDALAEVGEFAIEIGDDSLGEVFPRGTVLGFLRTRAPRPGDVVLALHRSSSMVVLRRARDPLLVGLTSDQPNYQLDRTWSILGRAVVIALPTD